MATMTLVNPQYSYLQGAYNGQTKAEEKENKYLCSDKPVDIQKAYDNALRKGHDAQDFIGGDKQVDEIAKLGIEQTNLLAAIYNTALQTNKRLDRLEQGRSLSVLA